MAEEFSQDLTFEVAMKRLEETVRKLESGELSLTDAIERYKEAMQLVQFCRSQLDKAELEIERLVESQGSITAQPMGDDNG
jgi:exodeoxyribonuclease VII small subunit